MRCEMNGEILRSNSDYLVPVKVYRWFREPRETRCFVTGQEEKSNVVAEDGLFVNSTLREWVISQVNKDIMKRRIQRQRWEE